MYIIYRYIYIGLKDSSSWTDKCEIKQYDGSHGWCIIKLGIPSIIYGFNIDTGYFLEDYAFTFSVESSYCPNYTGLEKDIQWVEVLPKVQLTPNDFNIFTLEKPTTICTHLRLHNYSRGQISRFYIYGDVRPVLPKNKDEIIDLLFIGYGGRVVYANNSYLVSDSSSSFFNVTRKLADKYIDNDSGEKIHACVESYTNFVVFHLGIIGHILQAEINTTHFKGNHPRKIKIEATNTTSIVPGGDVKWMTLIEPSIIGPNNVFYFNTIHTEKIFTHTKISISPDGEIKHLRLYGVIKGGKIPKLPIAIKRHIFAKPLTSENYAPYGDVIHTAAAKFITRVNQGTAEKYHHVGLVTNKFPNGHGKMNFCIFRCRPTTTTELPFNVKLLERHPYSSQAFIPMTDGRIRGYLIIVALNGSDDRPDMSTLKAFMATSKQGINYREGIWHHPMIALEHETDFVVIVHESGVPEDDCNEVNVAPTLVHVPDF
ncbi:ureidoglycolate hydrolase-domain-containing protein [Cokeromyces recurvatus]|uniref:ureidoglycolate hydrolase-domain-containing protein n=1 Tax=Cokeromyces recurvatus TaxID=90255 RepID=UPI0022204664|nr:ureidoglycolate hydrolase-domain-containing protein [Cokeromyces recurvatus]KAI7906547.1 ureidoglycolate hydrolase-domain-containing protein [Cokeromyces recurvatus]